MEGERRRHARSTLQLRATIDVQGAKLAAARVVDLSAGGVLIEVEPDVALPALGAHALAHLARGDRSVTRGARVVRLRWAGRELGVAIPRAVALVFDDGDATAASRLAVLLEA